MDLFEKIWFALFTMTIIAAMTCTLMLDSIIYDKAFLTAIFLEILGIVLYSLLFKIPTNKP